MRCGSEQVEGCLDFPNTDYIVIQLRFGESLILTKLASGNMLRDMFWTSNYIPKMKIRDLVSSYKDKHFKESTIP